MELMQFRYSPYNEKVRWALDLKRVPQLFHEVQENQDAVLDACGLQ